MTTISTPSLVHRGTLHTSDDVQFSVDDSLNQQYTSALTALLRTAGLLDLKNVCETHGTERVLQALIKARYNGHIPAEEEAVMLALLGDWSGEVGARSKDLRRNLFHLLRDGTPVHRLSLWLATLVARIVPPDVVGNSIALFQSQIAALIDNAPSNEVLVSAIEQELQM